MKKLLYLISSILVIGLIFTGCGSKTPARGMDSSAFAGIWNGCGNALGKNHAYRCENLSLQIGKDGTFTLSDIEQGTHMFSGTFSADQKNRISISASEDSQNILPHGWKAFDEKDTLDAQMPDQNHLILTYDTISYYFEKENSSTADMASTTVSPLLDIAENDIWYSSQEPGSDYIYELALYDKYAELYSLKAGDTSKGTFITNFLYQSNTDNQFTFFTRKNDRMRLPKMFSSLPEGLSQITLELSSSNEALHMTYEGQTLSFYNHVIYDTNTSSTAYYLNNTCFYWVFDDTRHFCHFSTDEESGRLYLVISDDPQEKTDAKNSIRGQIVIDEGGKAIIFKLNKQTSKKTADKHSALYQTFRKLDKGNKEGLRIPFTLKENRLKWKTKKYFGKNYTFDLTDYLEK